MKTVEMNKATKSLAAYAVDARKEPVIVTSRGKPVAAVVDVRGVDRESLNVSMNPKFLEILERSRQRRKKEGAIPLEEIKRKYGLAPSKKGKRKNGRTHRK